MKKLAEGYKQTDAGIIPDDWDVVTIASLCTIVDGGTPSTLNSAFWHKGSIAWCTAADITNTPGKYLASTERKITPLGLAKSSATLLPKGSLVLCSGATIGAVKVAQIEVATKQGFSSLVCGDNVHNEFMYYVVLTLKEEFLRISVGTTFLSIPKKQIGKIEIALPKLAEQKAIATALSDVDGLIENIERLIAKKRDVKTAAMQVLLTGKKRLARFGDGKGCKKTDIGNIPNDWDIVPIDSLCKIVDGGTPSTLNPAFWRKGNIAWCTAADITSTPGKYLASTERKITPLGLAKSSATLLPKGSLVLCSGATIGAVKVAQIEVATKQGFSSLVCGERVHNEFMYYVVLTLKDEFLRISVGTTFLSIPKKQIGKIEIALPKLAEQKAIANALSDMDSEIEALENRLAKTKAIKIAMMQELLTGKTRLVKP